jgi:uncharacterized protein with von Willebrand factor type A (vWA) domain
VFSRLPKAVTFKTTHFSNYLLVDRKKWVDMWREEINYRNPLDNQTRYYNIVLAIDSSGSVTTNDPSDLRKAAAKQFVDTFLPDNKGSVIDFDSLP